jgi:P27 family predicted phage terminase small subunit
MRGRKPTPIEQRVREGNPQHRPLPEPVIVGGRPVPADLAEPPADLPQDAQDFWCDSVVRLVEVGLIDWVDVPVLEMLATQYARVKQSRRVIAEDGHFALGSVGQIREHPALKIERESMAAFLRLAEQYGLTPVARTRLGLAELHRRSLEQEMVSALGAPDLRPV